MDRYIGLDAHVSSCTFGVVGPSGKRLGHQVVETNARALVAAVRAIPGTRHLCLEEGTLSGWLYEVLSPHVHELVVPGVSESRGARNDKLDAFARAEQLRIGAIDKKVYKDQGRFARLRHLAKGYAKLVGDSVRVQNRIKSLLRSRGVAASGQGVRSRTRSPAPASVGSWGKEGRIRLGMEKTHWRSGRGPGSESSVRRP